MALLPRGSAPARGAALSAALLADLAATSGALAVVLLQQAPPVRIALSLAATLGCALCVNVAGLLVLRSRRRARQQEVVAAAARAATAADRERGQRLAEGERQAAVERLASALGHDLASPIASASANLRFAEAELAQASPGAEVVEAVREARQALERMRRMLADLRALAPHGTAEVDEVDPLPAVGQGLRLAAARLGARAALEARLPPELPAVKASPPHLAHLVSVLVSAAAEGGAGVEPPGGVPVAVEARVDGEAVRLEVTGQGMPERAGAGVALCGELVRRWGGRVDAGRAPDGRTFFAVTLLRAAPPLGLLRRA